ncbi:hypothetical protein [Acuticoccus mangrovi]|uniref:DUF4399 domain-containing protein n=1 Tax=Acuticoccus mangrovi TaxID=2796142 RepID=A0A934MHQ0_9HYPH|nr:hypothetical protein [Acuticoccus mangrovi]MBJ3776321.1 hypothetical protein [Acuticoccus mangrovi]
MSANVITILAAVAGCVGVALASASIPANTGDRAPHIHGGAGHAAADHGGMSHGAIGHGATGHGATGHGMTPGGAVTTAHDHSRTIDVPAGADAPTVDFTIAADPHGGYNIHILTSNFRFAPDHASGPAVDGEGHAHIYADGVKLARVYGPWFHLAAVPAGATRLTVTLNTNDHATLAVDGDPVSATRPVPAGALADGR